MSRRGGQVSSWSVTAGRMRRSAAWEERSMGGAQHSMSSAGTSVSGEQDAKLLCRAGKPSTSSSPSLELSFQVRDTRGSRVQSERCSVHWRDCPHLLSHPSWPLRCHSPAKKLGGWLAPDSQTSVVIQQSSLEFFTELP